MIFLIGGAPRCGKTSLAIALSDRLHVPWVPTDYLAAGFARYHRRGGQLSPGESNDVRYSSHSTAEIVASYRRRARAARRGLLAFVEYALSEERDFVLEGFHCEPTLMAEVERLGPSRAVVLCRDDPEDALQALRASSDPNDWAVRYTRESETYRGIAAMIAAYSGILREEARRWRIPVMSMAGGLGPGLEYALDVLSDSSGM
jgi:2-phosphoglycerate kinase